MRGEPRISPIFSYYLLSSITMRLTYYFSLLVGLWLVPTLQVQAQDMHKTLQRQFIMAEAGDTIRIPAGTFRMPGSLSMDEKEDIVIMGAGIDETILTFKGQKEGAEGIRITNSRDIRIMHLTLQDAQGDLIKVMDTEGITFAHMRTEWTGRPKKSNGAYGFYPVSCTNVLIEHCEAIGASDAGIYVGQSHNIVVRNCRAYHNVAGIEIENSTMADVYECESYMNTGGILVFDLPDLPKAQGGNVRVYNNRVIENNYRNFAPKGNIVGVVPPGTGIIILATKDVEVYDNEIRDNRTAGTAIISYYMAEIPIQDDDYDPYPTRVYVHDNQYQRAAGKPTLKNKLGVLLFAKFGRKVPHILYDGIMDPARTGADGHLNEADRICIRNNGDATFANLDAENNFKNIRQDLTPYDCSRASLKAPGLTGSK
jgi:parallel beta-helix repeat protein